VIDIHSHILPGIDDGSPSLEVSLAMIRMAAAHGTTDIVATPHANFDYRFEPEVVSGLLAELEAAKDCEIRLHRGCDFHLAYENIEDALANPRKYTIDGGGYLLVEFSDLLILKTTSEIFGQLLAAGMTPVITHPERNLLLQQRVTELEEWVGMGCGIQVTGQSLLGDFGSKAKKFSETLMDRGMVHVIASDAHDLERRPPVMDQAREKIAGDWSEECAKLLCVDNPKAVLESRAWAGTSHKRKRSVWSLFS
jgi:protein-tyrosine phosphatase